MPINSPIRAVFFDAVGTLIFPDPPASAVYATAAREFGSSLDEAVVEQRFREVFDKYNSPAGGDLTTSEDRERSRWRSIVRGILPEVAPCDALFERLWRHFATAGNWRVYDDVHACFQRLDDAGLHIGIASNFDCRLLGICAGLPPLDRCRHIFISSSIGWRKPAPEFFRTIERAAALEPNQLLLIGDDWNSDYLGATAAGWEAILLDRTDNIERAAIMNQPTPILRSLRCLLL